jgi:hypothetical protein
MAGGGVMAGGGAVNVDEFNGVGAGTDGLGTLADWVTGARSCRR